MSIDRELIELAVKRDQQAFGKLYDLYVDKVYKYIYYHCRSAEDAEDITAQVFVKAWAAIENYRWEGYPFSTWLFRIAHNQLVDRYRTTHETLPLDTTRTHAVEGNPEEAAERSMTSEEIRSALQYLTEVQRTVVVLRFLEGYDISEIASILNKEPSAIRAIQHRALTALYEMLREKESVARKGTRRSLATRGSSARQKPSASLA